MASRLVGVLNIGPGELLAICVIALIVLGPDKLPQALGTMGRVMAEMRKVSTGFQEEIRHAFDEAVREDAREASTGDTGATRERARPSGAAAALPAGPESATVNGSSPAEPTTGPGGGAELVDRPSDPAGEGAVADSRRETA